jgi:hypothetical protein
MLGPVASTPVAAAPLAGAAASTGTTQVTPGYTFFPPGLKVPWQRFPVQGPVFSQGMPVTPIIQQIAVPGWSVVPRGWKNPGPWKVTPEPLLNLQQKAPVPPPPPNLVAPGFTFTPPGMFAPYGTLVHPVFPLPQIVPPVPGSTQVMPGFTTQPPGLAPNGPWRTFAVLTPTSVPPGFVPPVPPVKSSPNKTFLPRVPDINTDTGQARLRRHTEILSSIINSLGGTNQLVQTGPESWQIVGVYTPANPSAWSGTPPTTTAAAIDRLLAWLAGGAVGKP